MPVKIPTSETHYPPLYYTAQVVEDELILTARITKELSSERVKVSLTDAKKLARWILKQEEQ